MLEENEENFSLEGQEVLAKEHFSGALSLPESHLQQNLQDYYQPLSEQNQASLERIWRRFVQHQEQPVLFESQQIVPIKHLRLQKEGNLHMNSTHSVQQPVFVRQLSTMIAVLLMAFVIGGLVLVLNIAHKSSTTGSGGMVIRPQKSSPGIYIESQKDAHTYLLSKLDNTTRKVLWSYQLKTSKPQTESPANNRVVVEGSNVYVYGTGSSLSVLNAETGSERWSTTWTGRGYPDKNLVVDNGVVYLLKDNGSLVALNGTTGATLWTVQASTIPNIRYGSEPIIARDGLLYISVANSMIAFEEANGARQWTFPGKDSASFSLVQIVNNTLYAIQTDNKEVSTVYALDAKNGKERWEYPNPPLTYTPVIDNGILYLGGVSPTTGKIIALRASDGSKLWQQSIDGGSGVIVDNKVIFGGWTTLRNDATIYKFAFAVLGVKNGENLGTQSISGILYKSFDTDPGVTYVTTKVNEITAIRSSNNAVLWQQKFGPELVSQDRVPLFGANVWVVDVVK